MNTSNQSLKRKKSHPSNSGNVSCVLNEDLYNCPICFSLMEDPYITRCGHSFCCRCIKTSFENNNRCPLCSTIIEKKDDLFPNFILADILCKHMSDMSEAKKIKLNSPAFNSESLSSLQLGDINKLITVLQSKKEELEMSQKSLQLDLVQDFLEKIRSKKTEELKKVQNSVDILTRDIIEIQQKKNFNSHSVLIGTSNLSSDLNSLKGENSHSDINEQSWLNGKFDQQKSRLEKHLEELEQTYFQYNMQTGSKRQESIDSFAEDVTRISRFSYLKVLSTLSYHADLSQSSSIVSSIEFDRDKEFFVVGGVTKKIKIFDYEAVIKDHIETHYPICEMVCFSKISSLAWNSYHKGILASSDYEGTVTLWDAFSATKTKVYQEHEKRCWSVDFNRVDPKVLASASDDSKVKIWSINMDHSVMSFELKANVCSAKFNPESKFHLAFGSADHCIYYYDLRHSKHPICVLKGHKRAVSYARFLNPHQIVSASTDSQLRLWSVDSQQSERSFNGHINEKNFVGLTTQTDYIACGSENNSMYLYYKGLSKPLLTYKFEASRNVMTVDRKKKKVPTATLR